ncbi:serine acetyltransferase 4 isoform X3 [Eutrema salsugineum]|uniref:serine acetyltransferase 4 isoform X3 n=1 Tax=Eutrema salsugineum TaxID=72664 RepID=UPI000CED7FB2|nr:serine acetyltransferase 4 isoform X3 [Eutrema salsugineum]
MACINNENCKFSSSSSFSKLPLIDSRRFSTVEYDETGDEFPIERVFPVYARGTFTPEPNPVLLEFTISGYDPIWNAIREEAKLEAEKEPILSSFLYASILSHDYLEQALGFVLANRLQNPTLLATQLMDIFCNVMVHDRCIQSSIRLDLQVYRVAHKLLIQGRELLALALQSRVSEVFGIDIHPAARIGEGILLDHGTGVVIGETAVIGDRVSILHGVTLGGTGKETGDRHPKIGDGALLGACVTILGNIRIGAGAMVAAGSLVLKDVPSHSMVAGNPAKLIGFVDEQDPSLTMEHDATKEFFRNVAVANRGTMPNVSGVAERGDIIKRI